jgi:hypothetical protein
MRRFIDGVRAAELYTKLGNWKIVGERLGCDQRGGAAGRVAQRCPCSQG